MVSRRTSGAGFCPDVFKVVADLWCPNHKLLIIAVELSILHYLSLVRISLKLFLRRALRTSDNTGVSLVFSRQGWEDLGCCGHLTGSIIHAVHNYKQVADSSEFTALLHLPLPIPFCLSPLVSTTEHGSLGLGTLWK